MAETNEISKKIEVFFATFPLRKYGKGEVVVFADGTVPLVTYLISGTVEQYDISDQGNKLILTIYKPGTFFPMAHAVNKAPNHYFFEANEPVIARQAPAQKVVDFIIDNPDVLFDLLQRVYRGMDGVLGRMTKLMADSARNLLLFELSIMGERFGEKQSDGDSMRIRVTASQLATQTGLARETVSRELQKCADQDLLTLKKGEIILKNKVSLHSLK